MKTEIHSDFPLENSRFHFSPSKHSRLIHSLKVGGIVLLFAVALGVGMALI